MKSILPFLLALIMLFSCNEKSEMTTNTDKNEKIVRQLYTHFNNHDWAKMASLYADTADFKDPSLGQGIVKQTREQTIKKYTELHAMFADVHDAVEAIYHSGDKHVIVEFISSGTAPDGSKFTLPICTIFTIENGLITKDYTYYDNFEDPKSQG